MPPPFFSFSFFSQRSYMETKGWDVFRVLPPDQDSGSEATNSRCTIWLIKSCKLLIYLLTFMVVLGGTTFSKMSLFFMTSNIKGKRTIGYCNRELERDKSYQAEIPVAEQVRLLLSEEKNIPTIINCVEIFNCFSFFRFNGIGSWWRATWSSRWEFCSVPAVSPSSRARGLPLGRTSSSSSCSRPLTSLGCLS